MIKFLNYISTFIFIVTVCGSCYYDKFDQIHPLDGYVNPCDSTVDSSYTHSIRYIMAYNCTSCHNKNFSQGSIVLDNYASVAEQAQNGVLMGVVLHKSGYKPMPPGGQIPQCQIDKLQQWVNAKEPQ
jgi:cytochrome c5